MELKEMIKVMQHFENGGEVECSTKGKDDWRTITKPFWNWQKVVYKIKEQKQKVIIRKWLCQDVGSGEYFIYDTSNINLYIKETHCTVKVKLLESYEIEL